MSGPVLTAAWVDAAAQEGRREIAVDPETIVTPLARDRAAALGITLTRGAAGSAGSPGSPPPGQALRRRARSGVDVDRLVLESRVRILARRALLRMGRGLAELEDLVTAVMVRLYSEGRACGCDGDRR